MNILTSIGRKLWAVSILIMLIPSMVVWFPISLFCNGWADTVQDVKDFVYDIKDTWKNS